MSQNFNAATIDPAVTTPAGLGVITQESLLALQSNFSGISAPPIPVPYQLWADTSTGLLKIRNQANVAWISLMKLSTGEMLMNATLAANTFSGAQIFNGPVTVPAPAQNGHAVRMVGLAVFSVSNAVLTVHKQVGLSLTRSVAGQFPFTFAEPQTNSVWTTAVNHVRSTGWANSVHQIANKSLNGGVLSFVENSTLTDPFPGIANASTLIVFA